MIQNKAGFQLDFEITMPFYSGHVHQRDSCGSSPLTCDLTAASRPQHLRRKDTSLANDHTALVDSFVPVWGPEHVF